MMMMMMMMMMIIKIIIMLCVHVESMPISIQDILSYRRKQGAASYESREGFLIITLPKVSTPSE